MFSIYDMSYFCTQNQGHRRIFIQKGSENMNKIFKVIWSKSRNCYVVASELAKGTSKSTSTGRMAKRAALAAVAALLISPLGAGYVSAADADYVTLDGHKVYTKDGVDAQLSEYAKNSDISDLKAKTEVITYDKDSKTVMVDGKLTATEGITDGTTTQYGQYVKADNYVGQNLNALDTQVKANADAIAKKANQTDLDAINTEVAKKANQTDLDETNSNLAKKANQTDLDETNANLAKKAEQTALDETNAEVAKKADASNVYTKAETYLALSAKANAADVYTKTDVDNKLAADNTSTALHISRSGDLIIGTKENQTVKDMEIRGKLTSGSISTGDITSSGDVTVKGKMAADGVTDETTKDGTYIKQNNTVGNNLVSLDKQVKANAIAINKEATAREKEDARLNSEIVNTNKSLNEAATNLSKLNTAVVEGFKTLNQADANEAKARDAADKTLQTNIDNEAAAREAADVEEKAGRVAADTKLVEAVNGGLSLGNGNVLQTNKTSVEADGTVSTFKEAATTLVMNEGKDNQITLSENGIKVGKNSGVMDKDGFYAGGDNADAAAAALKADGSIKGAKGNFTVDGTTGDVSTKGSLTAASGKIGNVSMSADGTMTGVKDLTASGKITADSFTDGTATMSNGSLNGVNQINATGNIVTTGNMKAHDITAEGTIKGETINGTTGTFGSLSTTGNASVGGTLTTNGITNTGNTTTDTLAVNHNATVGGNLSVTGDITGKSLNVGTGSISGGQITGTGLDVGAGTIKTTGATETGTLKTTGKAEIGGDLSVAGKTEMKGNLDVKGDLSVEGEFNANTLSSKLDENNYTEIHGGNVTSVNNKVDITDGKTYTSTSTLTEKGKTETASNGINRNVNKMDATESSNVITNANGKTSTFEQRVDEILNQINSSDTVFSKVDQKVGNITSEVTDGTNTTSSTQTTTNITNTAKQGTITNEAQKLVNKASDTISNEAANDITNTSTNGNISNTANNGTISNTAKNIENTASENITNTVKNGSITNDAKNIANIASETLSNNAKNITNTTTDNMTNTIGKNLTTTVGGEMKTTVTGKVTEDYKSDLDTKVGGNQTTTVTGDSSLTAENITNEAKNKITNKALDVETNASSSIVSKVSNEYGSNTSTQLSYQTTEEMSQADGKKASYLRGAAEEKSQLTDGDKKTTIDTIAGQTNTNITDGTNTSNSLQKADQVASSVTDGTNTTVVNQDAKRLASSITDGTKANNTNSTVDKSEQLIKASDTQYSATTKTATKTEDALVSSSSVIDVIKSLDDAANPLISSVVTDGTNTTGVTQTAKDITNTAKNGTIANDAKDIINNAVENMTNTVGKDLTTTVGGEMKTTVTGDSSLSAKNITNTASETLSNSAKNITNSATEKLSNSAAEIENTATKSITDKVGKNTSWEMTDGTVVESVKDASGKTNQTTTTAADTYQCVKDGDNTLAKRTSSTNDNLNITDGTNTYSKITTATSNKQTVTDGKETASTNLTKSASNTLIENGTQSVLDHVAADTSYTVMNEKGNGSRRQQSASEILDRVTDGKDTSEVKQTASEVATSAKNITNTADTIKDVAGKTTVTTTDIGTTFENTNHSTAIGEGTITKTTISGNTLETGKATMDYADVMKDLGVHGKATIDGDTSVGGNLSVTGTSTLTGDVTMKSNATVEKDLTVKGTTTTDKLVVNKGATVTGGTTTDTLHVTSTSTFDGAATFKDVVTMEKDLSVGGNATVTGSMTASSYKVGDKIYIDSNGINANGYQIRNVADGAIAPGSTDAVNGSQLYQTNERVTGVENKVNKLDSRVDKVGANAAALANLHPLEFDADSKWNIAAAVGGYKGETATAIGAFYRPNENVMVNVSSSFGTGENMYGGGISLRIGQGGNKARRNATNGLTDREKAMQKQIDSLTNRLDALLSVINPNMSKDFPDVPENHWAYEAVSRLAGNGVIQGYEDGKYHGDRTMTRYEMAEIIYNALSKGAKAEKKLVEEFKPELQAMAAQKKA